MAKPNSYAGETDAKRLARLAVYRRIEELQPREVREEGKGAAVVLCGPTAGELGSLKHFLKMSPKSVWFVDKTEKKGLQQASLQWPEVNTHFGDVGDVLYTPKLSEPLAFLNFDFCGYLTEERERIVRRMALDVADWGMVFYTFFRGRENSKRLEDILRTDAETMDGKRVINTAENLHRILGSSFVPVFSLRYTGVQTLGPGRVRLGSMAILGFQKVPKGIQRYAHWWRMVDSPSPYGGYVPTDKRLLTEHLRVEALALRSRNLNSKEVASILNLPQGTVAAWFAIQTRQ